MTNLETTDQFRAANKRWQKEKNKDTVAIVTGHAVDLKVPAASGTVDADGDTVMAPARTTGDRYKR